MSEPPPPMEWPADSQPVRVDPARRDAAVDEVIQRVLELGRSRRREVEPRVGVDGEHHEAVRRDARPDPRVAGVGGRVPRRGDGAERSRRGRRRVCDRAAAEAGDRGRDRGRGGGEGPVLGDVRRTVGFGPLANGFRLGAGRRRLRDRAPSAMATKATKATKARAERCHLSPSMWHKASTVCLRQH